MLRFLARRFVSLLVVLLALSLVLFLLQSLSPTDAVHMMLGENASAAQVAHMRHELGLDQPLYVQYVRYLGEVLHGDLGISYQTRKPVSADLAQFVPATLELGAAGMVLAIVMGTLFAVSSLAVARWAHLLTGVYRNLILALAAAPPFLLGLLGLILFYKEWGVLPASGRIDDQSFSGPTGFMLVDTLAAGRPDLFGNALQHLLLPALAIAIGPSLVIGRVFASSLRGTLDFDYVRTAMAKGLTEGQIVRRHVIRNASNPVLSLVGLQIGAMFAGTLVVENIFGWPGLGQYMSRAIGTNDFPVISAVTLILGAGYVVVNTVVEIVQAGLDPRLRLAA